MANLQVLEDELYAFAVGLQVADGIRAKVKYEGSALVIFTPVTIYSTMSKTRYPAERSLVRIVAHSQYYWVTLYNMVGSDLCMSPTSVMDFLHSMRAKLVTAFQAEYERVYSK